MQHQNYNNTPRSKEIINQLTYKKMKKKTKHRITISRLNGTGVQELFYGKIKAGNNIWIEGEKYTILTTRKKDKKGKWKYTYSKK